VIAASNCGSVLVTGGAGYIGCHVVHALLAAGHRVVVLDDLSTGRRDLVAAAAELVEGDAGDRALLDRLIPAHGIDAVVHLAGSAAMPESVARPLATYRNNVLGSWALIAACVAHGVGRFVLASSAAVYGDTPASPVAEDCAPAPVTPYGRSKLACEWMLADAGAVSGMRVAALRYFNVAGADPGGRCGQAGPAASDLVTVACAAAAGRRDRVEIFGTDYPTPDGTCIRDFIHVSDLADLHVAALDHLQTAPGPLTLNCGTGQGASVCEVLAAVEARAGRALSLCDAPRRAGDAPEMVADASRLRRTLDWRPRHGDLDVIIATALAWERKLGEPAPAASGN
jgi:UDP-glucose 4-epimerase